VRRGNTVLLVTPSRTPGERSAALRADLPALESKVQILNDHTVIGLYRRGRVLVGAGAARVMTQAVPLPKRIAVLVIGGGIQGLSIAFNLAARGERQFLVLDAGYFQGGSSGRNGTSIRGGFMSEAGRRCSNWRTAAGSNCRTDCAAKSCSPGAAIC
jgi:hypothetical protein